MGNKLITIINELSLTPSTKYFRKNDVVISFSNIKSTDDDKKNMTSIINHVKGLYPKVKKINIES